MTRAAFIGVSILAFAAGAMTTWLVNRPAVDAPLTVSPASESHDVAGVSAWLEGIDRRLAAIEASMLGVAEDKSDPSPTLPTATRANDQAFDQLRAELASLRDEMRARTAGLGELLALQPQPDAKALDALRAQCGNDQKLVKAAFLGMTYRDVVLQFGSPTVKFAAVVMPATRTHPEMWIWESPAGDLAVTFENGAAIGAGLYRTGVTRKFLEDSENQ